ncbi:MAG: hypothetical protein OXF49_02065 [Candidatus Saccharibacteria bacterium]|nr:hypothetical protein [Candidatus Saccharibacteria bacterium]
MLTEAERLDLKGIEDRYYMPPIIKRLERLSLEKGYQESMSHLYSVINDAKNEVMKIIHSRQKTGKISNVSQASRAVVGNIFANSIIYL